MPSKQIVIYGGGGCAREVAWLIQSCNIEGEKYRVACFADDDETSHGTELNGIPIMSLETARRDFPFAAMVLGVGIPRTREYLMTKAATAGFRFETIIHPRAERSQWVEIGLGTVICSGVTLTTNISIGHHVQINLNCTICHDVVIGDFTTLSPGVHVSGCVHFGERVCVGAGAVIVNGTKQSPITIGDDVVIGAGACVTKSIASGITVVGIPAKPIQQT